MTGRRCVSCGAELEAAARFCSQCGAEAVARGDERRVATVLFADVAGFTHLSEEFDPEQVKTLLDRCFQELAGHVTAHGGRVDKIVGDEIMAVFGAPIAHEDDPERAVRTALQMQRALEELAAETGSSLTVRIGINTGEVVVGALGGGEVTALGDVVNVAKRLESAAAPGTILVGPATYRATRSVISYEGVGPVLVKGRESPVEAWRALEAIAPPGFRRRIRTPLYGRDLELGLLRHAIRDACERKASHLVLVVGEAGVGKTRIVEEAVEEARSVHGAFVLEGRCLPYGEANPWWPVAEALRRACGIDVGDDAGTAAQKCRRAVAGALRAIGEEAEANRVTSGLLYLMGFEGGEIDPARARDEATRALQRALAANARRQPVVVVLSEIHWADELVLGLLGTLLERLRALPVVVVATARPELEERWAPRLGSYDLLLLRLEPLERGPATDLVRTLLGGTPPPELVEALVDRAGGNPFFLEELATIVDESGRATELPSTLRGLVAARIDVLGAAERSVLEDAAVVGRSGPVEILEALARSRGGQSPEGGLDVLEARDLISVERDSFVFASEVVRDVAYARLTKAERARRHAAVGEWFEAYAERTERRDEFLERIAHHFGQAALLAREVGAQGAGALEERALEWLERAAVRAEARDTPAVALPLVELALRLVGGGSAEDGGGESRAGRRAVFTLHRARAYAARRDGARVRADLDRILGWARSTRDLELEARALTLRGEVEQHEGALEEAARTLEEATRLWRELGDRRGEAESLRLWGLAALHGGRLDGAEGAIGRALEISRQLGDRRGEAWALQNLAWAAFSRGDYARAEERLRASSDLFEAIGDWGGRAWAHGLLGYVWYFKGLLADAAAIAERAVSSSAELGDLWAHGMMLNLLAGVRLWQGRTCEALERSREALRLFQDMGDKTGLDLSRTVHGAALVFRGGRDEALALLGSGGGGEGAAIDFVPAVAEATVRAVLGEGEEALAILDRAGVTGAVGDADLLATRALCLLVAERVEDALACALAAHELGPEEPGSRSNVGCIFALCAAAAGRAEDALRAGDEVASIGGTYLDHIRAHLARALAATSLGRRAEGEAALRSASSIADASEDLLHQALVRLAAAVAGLAERGGDPPEGAAPEVAFSDLGSARDALARLGARPASWEAVFRRACRFVEAPRRP